ncbi:hypothetical protein Zmor_022657 [Zophobas morio]|uniref:Uncharacterized protein n=1 Tax=Zophobas morio TaxID=2755281 RepID=A0AA38M682_9CUCU|nr:hypothetical protein Zmor_022657 [Zophobas morio]
MSSDSDSSLELQDIQWETANPIFNYNNPLSTSLQLRAVIEDNIAPLQALLDSGKSVNIKDKRGNTPLHVAVLKQKKKVFDYLLTRDEVRIDAANFEGFTPLMFAIIYSHKYFTLHLIEKGADLNVRNNAGACALHFATHEIYVAQVLIEKGADINAQDCHGRTPFYSACVTGHSEFVHLMVCFGADPMVTTDDFLPFDASVDYNLTDVQEVLYYFTFDEGCEVSVKTMTVLMIKESPFFQPLIDTCSIVYDENDLSYLRENLHLIEPETFKIFMDKYENVVRDMFTEDYPLLYIFTKCSAENGERFVYALFESRLRDDLIPNVETCLKNFIRFRRVGQNFLTRFVCYLLSYGCEISTCDMNAIYRCFGFGELFKILLHMKIIDHVCSTEYFVSQRRRVDTEFYNVFSLMRRENVANELGMSLIPSLIYDFGLKFNIINEMSPETITLQCLENLIKFFAHPQLIKCCKFRKLTINIPNVPSLLELSRECVRENLIKHYGIKNNMQLHTLLNHLPVYDDLKAILRYEKPIYNY